MPRASDVIITIDNDEEEVCLFDFLPVDIKILILVNAISEDSPKLVRDLTRLSAVSKQFHYLCHKYVAKVFYDLLGEQNKKRYDSFFLTEHQSLHSNYLTLQSPLLDNIRKNIIERKKIMNQGVMKRNKFMLNGECFKKLTTCLTVILITLLISLAFMYNRLFVCIDKSGEESDDCLNPLSKIIEELFGVSHSASEDISTVVFLLILFTSPTVAAALERFIFLLVDCFKLIVLKYQESQALIEHSKKDENLYILSKKIITLIKWQEIICAGDKNYLEEINKVKQQDYYQTMVDLAAFEDQKRALARKKSFLDQPTVVNEEKEEKGEEEVPLLRREKSASS